MVDQIKKCSSPKGRRGFNFGSLTAKLFHIKVGETIYFDDVFSEGKATIMERSVCNLIAKSPDIAGRKYRTERFAAVQTAPAVARQILGVTRIE